MTGHKTTDIVLKHYFRQTLQPAMPKLFTNRHKSPKEEIGELTESVKTKTLQERLLKVWAKL